MRGRTKAKLDSFFLCLWTVYRYEWCGACFCRSTRAISNISYTVPSVLQWLVSNVTKYKYTNMNDWLTPVFRLIWYNIVVVYSYLLRFVVVGWTMMMLLCCHDIFIITLQHTKGFSSYTKAFNTEHIWEEKKRRNKKQIYCSVLRKEVLWWCAKLSI